MENDSLKGDNLQDLQGMKDSWRASFGVLKKRAGGRLGMEDGGWVA